MRARTTSRYGYTIARAISSSTIRCSLSTITFSGAFLGFACFVGLTFIPLLDHVPLTTEPRSGLTDRNRTRTASRLADHRLAGTCTKYSSHKLVILSKSARASRAARPGFLDVVRSELTQTFASITRTGRRPRSRCGPRARHPARHRDQLRCRALRPRPVSLLPGKRCAMSRVGSDDPVPLVDAGPLTVGPIHEHNDGRPNADQPRT